MLWGASTRSPHGGASPGAAHYPAKFCRVLCKGMRRQARVDAWDVMSVKVIHGNGYVDDVGEVTHVPEHWHTYWDDISGKELDGQLVREAARRS